MQVRPLPPQPSGWSNITWWWSGHQMNNSYESDHHSYHHHRLSINWTKDGVQTNRINENDDDSAMMMMIIIIIIIIVYCCYAIEMMLHLAMITLWQPQLPKLVGWF